MRTRALILALLLAFAPGCATIAGALIDAAFESDDDKKFDPRRDRRPRKVRSTPPRGCQRVPPATVPDVTD